MSRRARKELGDAKPQDRAIAKELKRTEARERAARAAIAEAEAVVLRLAAEVHSLQGLREALRKAAGSDQLAGVDAELLPVAIFRLLNSGKLELTADRELAVR